MHAVSGPTSQQLYVCIRLLNVSQVGFLYSHQLTSSSFDPYPRAGLLKSFLDWILLGMVLEYFPVNPVFKNHFLHLATTNPLHSTFIGRCQVF